MAAPERDRSSLIQGTLVALGAAGLALWLAERAGVEGPGAVDEALRVGLAALALWGLSGYALARIATPSALRPHWPLLILPTGAVVSALALTALGFAAVPFGVSLPLVLAGGAVSAVWAWRRPVPAAGEVEAARGDGPSGALPAPGGLAARLAWPAFIACLAAAVVLLPIFRTGSSTIVGTSGDAHLAAGTAEFLKHSYPTSSEPELPLDQVPLAWRSKIPIYYSFAAISELSGLDTIESFAPLAAVLIGLAVIGFFLCAHYLLRAGPAASLLGGGLVAANGITFFTATHPYLNQTWGLLALPFILVLGWWALRDPRPGTLVLAAMFTAVGAFAYPLMIAFPAAALAAALAVLAWRRREEGRPIAWRGALRSLSRRRRLFPVYLLAAAALAYPAYGIFEKVASGVAVVVGNRSLEAWSGDLREYLSVSEFLSLVGFGGLGAGLLVVAAAALAVTGLVRAPRAVGVALALVFAAAALAALLFSERDFGWYFYFKVLAYLGPIVLIAAAAGLGRLALRGPLARGAAVAVAAAWLVTGALAVDERVTDTVPQVTSDLLELRQWDRELPAEASVRIDLDPEAHQWISFMLHRHRVASRDPLTWAGYPHVPFGRKADYVIADPRVLRPQDAVGRPLRRNENFVLYRMDPDTPGRDRASRRMVQTIRSVPLI